MSFKEIQKEKTAQIEQILKAYLPRVQGYQEVIMDAMSYSMLAGGKRLRPMLMQETYRMFGGADRVIEPFMAAIEMIHTYSLVHDDLPAMDNDEYRRGRKTTHVVYGEDMGILTGDALLNYAFETAASAFEMAPEKSLLTGKAIRILGQKAGIYGMIGGQVIDTENEGKQLPENVLLEMYRMKTGALLEFCCRAGVIAAGGGADLQLAAGTYARKLGLAFQIVDDILDVTADEKLLGKPVGSDAKNHKSTYVTLYGLQAAHELAEKTVAEALECLEMFGENAEPLREITRLMTDRKK